jgi:hypothetical protein
MRKMKFIVLCFMVMMAFASSASAATSYVQWLGIGEGVGSWTDGTKWNGGVVPSATDHWGVVGATNYKAGFKTAPNYADLSSGTVTTDILVFGAANAGNLDNLVVKGATVNVSQYITLAAAATDNGIVRMNSGTISTGVQNANSTFFVTQLGKGTLYMNGGTINCGLPDPTWVGRPANYSGNLLMTGTTGVTGNGTLYLNGGTIYANDLLPGTSGTARSLVITDGKLVLKTDRRAEIAGYSWITTTKPGGVIATSYDDLELTTTVYATPEPATVCLLGLGAMALLRRNKK